MAPRYPQNQYSVRRSGRRFGSLRQGRGTGRPGRTRTALLLAASLVAAGGASAVIIPLASAAECTDVDVVVARGTGENGELGTVVGDPLFAALQQADTGKSMSSHPVDYPANLSRQSAAIGNQELVDHVTAQAAACPDQKFVLAGYSQGANVVDNSLGVSSEDAVVGAEIVAEIPAQTQDQVAAVVLFGNPIRKNGDSLGGDIGARLLDTCAAGDVICEPGGRSLQAHLSYNKNGDVALAADFAANLITPGSSPNVVQAGTVSGNAGAQGAQGAQGQENGQQAGGRKLPGLRPGGLKPGGGKLGGLKPGGKLGGAKPGGKLGGLKPGGKLAGLRPGGGG